MPQSGNRGLSAFRTCSNTEMAFSNKSNYFLHFLKITVPIGFYQALRKINLKCQYSSEEKKIVGSVPKRNSLQQVNIILTMTMCWQSGYRPALSYNPSKGIF